MRRYKKFQNTSEAIWYTSLPDLWKSIKMRQLFSERTTKVSDKDFPPLSVGYMGVVPQLANAAKTNDGDSRKLIRTGDFAINSRSDRKGAGGISKFDGSCSLIITVLKPHNEINGKFYHYLLRSHYFSEEFYRNGYGIVDDLWTTKWRTMRNIYLPVPPREEQDQIVRYLNWKVSEINRLIAIKKEEIKRILELKEAFISHAFHFEKNSDRWDIRPLKWFVTSNDESLSASTPESYEIRYLDISSVGYGRLNHEPTRMTFGGAPSRARRIVREGDTIISTVRTYLKSVCFIDSSLDECIASTGFSVLRPRENVHSPLLGFALTTNFFINEVIANSIGIAYPAIADTKLMSLKIALPRSIEEQQLLYMSLKDKAHSYDKGIEYLTETIHKLHDIKSRLISDVVTGQIDVRDVKVPDFDFIEEEFDENFDEDIENSDFNNEED
jgi:type I restriction enzyme S subunit